MRVVVMLLAVGVFGAASATAQERVRVQLRYERPEGCPSEQTFRDIVAGRLGYDPFGATGSRTVVALIEGGQGFRGRVEILDADGTSQGERSFDSAEPSCAELARSIAIAITLTLDPLGTAQSAEQSPLPSEAESTPEPTTADVETTETSQEEEEPEEPPNVPELLVQVGMVGGVRSAPHPTLGPIGALGFHWGAWRALAGVSADRMLTSATLDSGDRVDVHLWSAFASVCGEYSILVGCAGVDAGQLVARGNDLVNRSPRRDRYGAFRVSGGVEGRLIGSLALQALIELRVPWYRSHLVIHETRVWSLPRASARLVLSLVLRIGRRISPVATSSER